MPARSISYMKFLFVLADLAVVLFTIYLANICSLFENLKFCSFAEAEIVLILFLNFEQK